MTRQNNARQNRTGINNMVQNSTVRIVLYKTVQDKQYYTEHTGQNRTRQISTGENSAEQYST